MERPSPGEKELITPLEAIDYYTLSHCKTWRILNTPNGFTVKYYDGRHLIIRREFEKYLESHQELRRMKRGGRSKKRP